MYVRLGTAATLCVAVATLVAQGGQSSDQQPQPPSFVTGTHYVRVDMYVTRDGVLVDDLRPEEVRIYEDGVPQAIKAFERIAIRRPDPLEPRLEPRTMEESRRLAAEPGSRLFVVFLDPYSTVVGTLRPFHTFALDSELGPDDLVAVMTPDMRPEDLTFTRGLRELPSLNVEPDETEMLYALCYPPAPGGPGDRPADEMIRRRRERMTFDLLESLVTYLGALREERTAVLFVSNGWRIYTPNPSLATSRFVERPAPPRPPIGGRRGGGDGDRSVIVSNRGVSDVNDADRAKCEADRAALALLDHRLRPREIIGHANRNNVSFYPVSPAGSTTATTPFGLTVWDVPYENKTPLELQSGLRDLAEQTDGYAMVNTNDFADGITRIIADSSAYYLLGYTSTNADLDGTYRRITVRVDRPGVHVRARPGYLAAPPVSAVEVEAFDAARGRPDPVAMAIDHLAVVDGGRELRLREAAWAQPMPGGGTAGAFWLAGEVDAQTRRGAGVVTADVSVLNGRGEPVLSHQVEVPAIHPAFAVRVPEAGTVEPGEYVARVHLRDGTGATVASETIRVTVPEEPATLGEALLWRRGPSTGPQPVQAADPRFRRNERLRLEVPVVSPDPVSARLLDRSGTPLAAPVSITERPDDAEAFRWAVVDLTLAPLAAGDYLIEVAQGEARRLTAFRLIP